MKETIGEGESIEDHAVQVHQINRNSLEQLASRADRNSLEQLACKTGLEQLASLVEGCSMINKE